MIPEAAAAGRAAGLLPRLRLTRLPNAVTAVADVLAGGALAGVPAGRLIPLAATAVLFYAGGCVLNDLLDREGDRRKHPKRPLPAGMISPAEAAALAISLLGAGLMTAAIAGRDPALAGGLLLALILAYDLRTKDDPIFGPATMGACRAAAVALGMSPAFPPPGAVLCFPAATLFYVYALSRLARWEAVPPPARPPVAGIAGPAALALLATGTGALLLPDFSLSRGAPFAAALLFIALPALRRGLRGSRPGEVAKGVTMLILALPLLEAFAAAGAGGWLWGLAASACALPAWLARRRFYIT